MSPHPHDPRMQRILATVDSIPARRVATYGQVARLADLPGQARQVGYALHALPDDQDVPWQRVINAQGRVSPRGEPEWEDVQRQMLECEGVRFDDSGRTALSRYQWKPRDPGSRDSGPQNGELF